MKTFIKFCIFSWFFTNNFLLHAQIPYADRHSQVLGDTWMSNTKSTSPNASRGLVHWIRYDLGDTYALTNSKFWNINVPGLTNAGAKTMIIDYSVNGTTWAEWGRLDIPQATGNTLYEGVDGPNFSGLVARYILINITSNYGHASNFGIAEMKVQVAPTTTIVNENILSAVELKASPNPFNNETEISIKGIDHFENIYYQLTDIAGRTLETKSLNSNSVILDGKMLSTGIYNFTVIHLSGIKSIKLNVVK